MASYDSQTFLIRIHVSKTKTQNVIEKNKQTIFLVLLDNCIVFVGS